MLRFRAFGLDIMVSEQWVDNMLGYRMWRKQVHMNERTSEWRKSFQVIVQL